MISPEHFIWLILILVFITSILKIFNGALKSERPTHYSFVDVVDGIFGISIVMFCIL